MKNVTVRKREMNVTPLQDWIVEDTHDYETIHFTIDEDVTGLSLFLLYRNKNDEGGVEALSGNDWTPSHTFTAVDGEVKIQLIAVDGDTYPSANTIRWSTKYATISVQQNIEAEILVPEPQQTEMEDIAGGLV